MPQHLVGGICVEGELVDALGVDMDEDICPAVTATTWGLLELDRGAQFEEGLVGGRHPVYIEEQAGQVSSFLP